MLFHAKIEKLTESSTNQMLLSLSIPNAQWTHIELGAANYGENVKADLSHISLGSPGQNQFELLFRTIENLIQKKGKKGAFYVNDLHETDVVYTIAHLDKYMTKYHPDSEIEFKPLIGDFFKIDLPKVDSIHLKNPEFYFFTDLDKEENKNRLIYFADCSKENLTLTTYYTKELLVRIENLGIGYKILNDNYSSYIHADGLVIKNMGSVIEFSIKSTASLKENEKTEFLTKQSFSVPVIKKSDVLPPDEQSMKTIEKWEIITSSKREFTYY